MFRVKHDLTACDEIEACTSEHAFAWHGPIAHEGGEPILIGTCHRCACVVQVEIEKPSITRVSPLVDSRMPRFS